MIAHVFIGAGNGDKLNWIKQLAFMDSNVASATNADTVDGKHASDVYLHEDTDDHLLISARAGISFSNKVSFANDITVNAIRGIHCIKYNDDSEII